MEINCNPYGQESIDMFDDKNKSTRSIFKRILLNDQGKLIARKQKNNYDVQVVYKDFLKHRTNSVKDSLKTSSQLSCLTVSRIDEWKGTD